VTEPLDVPWTGADAPRFAHAGDAGADLVATESVVLAPGERRLIGTGVRIALPDGYAGFVVPRSGLAATHGEVKVALLNTDTATPYAVEPGDRIAQLIVMPVPAVRYVRVEELPDSERGHGGFGSSGYGTAVDVRVAAVPSDSGTADARQLDTDDEEGTDA
jgi:dUTP pyrophosphatase